MDHGTRYMSWIVNRADLDPLKLFMYRGCVTSKRERQNRYETTSSHIAAWSSELISFDLVAKLIIHIRHPLLSLPGWLMRNIWVSALDHTSLDARNQLHYWFSCSCLTFAVTATQWNTSTNLHLFWKSKFRKIVPKRSKMEKRRSKKTRNKRFSLKASRNKRVNE